MRLPVPLSCRSLLACISLASVLAGCTVPPQAGSPVSPPAAASSWAALQTQVGRYPTDGADFLRSGPLADRLRALLGPANYPVLLENMGVSGPLQRDGRLLYVTGNRPHQGGSEAAAVVLDPAADAVRVWLLTGGEEWEVQDHGVTVPLPADVRTMVQNARR